MLSSCCIRIIYHSSQKRNSSLLRSVCSARKYLFEWWTWKSVEPRDHFLDSNKGLVGRTLVQNNSKVPVRFMNLSADANTIYKGTYVGNLAQASQVFEEGISSRGKQPWSKEFIDLKKETLSKLDSKQQTQVDNFLLKYATLFAGSGYELGRTDVVKHSIKTSDASPIKQPPRRLSFHM